MPKEIIKIWSFFKKAVVKWKYLKSKNKFRVCLEGTKKEFKENFNYEFKEKEMPPTPTVKQLLLEHIKDFKNFKVYVESRFDKQEQFNNEITKRFDKQEQFNNKQEEFNKKQEQFNNEIKNDLKIIKSVPIIKEAFKK